MSVAKMTSALMKSVRAVNIAFLEELPVRWPNVDITPPNESPYLSVDLLPNPSRVVTLGNQGEDEHTGILQIGLFYPIQQGNGDIAAAEVVLRDFYVPGVFFSHEGQTVQVTQFGVTPAKKDGSVFKCFASVYYMARTQRALDQAGTDLLLATHGDIPTP